MNARRLVVCLVAAMLVVMSAIPTFAASSEVYITVEATAVDVTVPGGGEGDDSGEGTGAEALPIVFKADGSNVYPTNWTITNNSKIAGVTLKSVKLTGTNGWELLGSDTDTKTLAADSKKIKFYMGKPNQLEQIVPNGTTLASPITIPAEGSQTFGFKVDRAAFSQAQNASKAFDMLLVFEF